MQSYNNIYHKEAGSVLLDKLYQKQTLEVWP